MLPNSSANQLGSSASSGGWGGITSGILDKPRSYKGTTSDEESEPDDSDVVTMNNSVKVLPPGPTSSSSYHQARSADAPKTTTTEHNQHLKPPVVDYDHDTSSDEDRSHRIPGAFIWTPTRPRFKKLHPH